jgi:hypothetical protein
MGKTALSYRLALQFEIEAWKPFRKALQSKEDLEAFEELWDMCRNNSMAAGAACRPEVFEAAVMSVLLAQTKRTSVLEEQLNAVRAVKASLKVLS